MPEGAFIRFDGSHRYFTQFPDALALQFLGVERKIVKTDSQLKSDVCEVLSLNPQIDANHVSVMTEDGVATLTGHLNTYTEKQAVERAVQRVEWVKAIAVELDSYPIQVLAAMRAAFATFALCSSSSAADSPSFFSKNS